MQGGRRNRQVNYTTEADVYLGLGANLGNRNSNLKAALERLRRLGSIQRVSSIYETQPVGQEEQPPFLNMACHMITRRTPHEVLETALLIERELGRRRTTPHAPRQVDIDILLYDDLVLSDSDLMIPHRRLDERAFVLVPLAEIAPDALDPRSGATIRRLLQRCGDTHWVRPYEGGEDVQTIR